MKDSMATVAAPASQSGPRRRVQQADRIWLALSLAGGGMMGALALVLDLPWLAAALGGLLGLAGFLIAWPVGPFLALHTAALVTHYTVEVGPVTVRSEHVAVILVGALVVWKLWRNRRRPRVTMAGWFALGWWGMNILATVINAVNPRDSLRHIIRLGLMGATYLVIANLLHTRRAWWLAFTGFLVLGVLEAAYGLLTMALYRLGVNLGLQLHRHIPIPIPYGTLQEGNLYGSHSASWALVFLWLVLARWRSRSRWWFVAGLAVTSLATGLSFARGAWLAFGLSALIGLIFYRRSWQGRWRRAAWVAIFVPLTLALLIGIAQIALPGSPLVGRLRTFGALMSDATFAARVDDYALAVSDWLQHPWIGWGPGAFFQLHGMRRWEPAWISNLTLRTLHETGAFGLLFFAGFVSLVLAEAVGTARRANSADRAALLGLALGFFCLMLAYQSTDGMWLAAPWVHAGLLATGASALQLRDTEEALA